MAEADARTQWGVSLWQATASRVAVRPALTQERRADVAIIGGGFTGLSSALHAARAGRSVVLLEAETIAWGASGRNAGFVVPNFAKMDPDAILARLGWERGGRLIDLAARSGAKVFGLIAEHGIACDARQSGWIQPAHAEIALPRVEARAAQWAARGKQVAVLDRREVEAMTGCRHFVGGWVDFSGGVLHPVNYALGLARAAERAGAALFEGTPAVAIVRRGKGWLVSTPAGNVSADRVILATNAYGGALQPQLRRCYFPLKIFQVATYPLPAEARRRLLPGGQCVSDTRRNLFTFRFDAENRLISGGMHVLDAGAERRVPQKIHRRLARLLDLPDLPPLAYAWSGTAAVMPDFLPHLIELAPGLLAGIGCNGRGIAITTMLGEVLADWAGGARLADLPVPAGPPSAVPFHDLTRHAPRALLPVALLRDALDLRRQRIG